MGVDIDLEEQMNLEQASSENGLLLRDTTNVEMGHKNQDNGYLDAQRQFLVVADGMGGHVSGEIARYSPTLCSFFPGKFWKKAA